MLRRSCEWLVLLTVAFVVSRIVGAHHEGQAMADRERRAIEALKAIHSAQRDAVTTIGTRFLWLSELVERGGATATPPAGEGDRASAATPLSRLASHPSPDPKVEVFRVRGYFVALFLSDPVKNDGRAWAPSAAESDEVGQAGYGAFAWPEEYQEGSQWAFYLDHRGSLLGSWNHKAQFDGFQAPFPPIANPLKDYNQAKRDDANSEWFLFDDVLGEIETPAAKSARTTQK